MAKCMNGANQYTVYPMNGANQYTVYPVLGLKKLHYLAANFWNFLWLYM